MRNLAILALSTLIQSQSPPSDLESDYDRFARQVVARDTFPVLHDPALVAADAAKDLGDSEPVIGIAIGGEAKAYPVTVMGTHELANDSCGGEPIAVSW